MLPGIENGCWIRARNKSRIKSGVWLESPGKETMHSQTVRLFIYSSLAIVALTLVWGTRQIPRQGVLAEEQLRTSLEQELSVLASAVKSSTAAMKYRLLDVLKAEGNDHPTRAFQESPFQSAALLEWDGG